MPLWVSPPFHAGTSCKELLISDNSQHAVRSGTCISPSLEAMFKGVTPEIFQTDEDHGWLEMLSVGKEIID